MASKFIAFANRKGGTGKSTLLILIATALKERSHSRVLIVDADSQQSVMKYAKRDGSKCDVVPFDWSLPNVSSRLGKLADESDEKYDFVFFDLQGSLDTEINFMILKMCDVIVIPFTPSQMTFDSTQSFIEVLPQVTNERAAQKLKTDVFGVLTMDDKTLEGKAVVQAIKDSGLHVLDNSLGFLVRYRRDLSTNRQLVTSTNETDEFNQLFNEFKIKIDG